MRALAGGRYVFDERIAGGGMGEVWRAHDTTLDRDVAIKLLRSEIADDEDFRSRFESEARHAAALHDSSIATVFDYGDERDEATGRHTTYLVMELVDGPPLSQLITGPMAPTSAAHLVAQVADGLAVAHAAGIVHRDVKPANFIVTPDGRVKITDFGIARALGAASITQTGTILGTPHYVAPEVAEGREATPASDIYSLGVVLFECLTGARPFVGETPIAVAMAHLRDKPPPLPVSVPPGMRSLVEASMDKDPARRPPSAASFAGALREAAATSGSDAPTVALGSAPPATQVLAVPTPEPPPPHRRKRARWLAVAGAAVAVLLLVGVAYAMLGGGPEEPTPTAGQQTTSGPQTPASTTSPPRQSPSPSTPLSQSPTTPPTTSAAPGVAVNADDYVGQDAKDAEDALGELGLDVQTESTEGGEKDIVAGVTPTGTVPPGSEVTLVVYEGERGPAEDDDNGVGDGNGKGDEKGRD